MGTICLRSSYPFYIVTYYIKLFLGHTVICSSNMVDLKCFFSEFFPPSSYIYFYIGARINLYPSPCPDDIMRETETRKRENT